MFKRINIVSTVLFLGSMTLLISTFRGTEKKILKDAPQSATPHSRPVENFSLLDQKGQFRELFYNSDKKAVVLISQGNSCPIIRKYIPYLEDLKKTYEPQGVVFWMINSFPQDDRDALVKESQEYNIDIPILEDPSQIIANSLHLTRTSEAVVINPKNWMIVYQGPIADALGYGTPYKKINHPYLKNAVEGLLSGQPVDIHPPEAQGCLIPFETNQDRLYTYTADVAPILAKHCVVCHSPDGAAPWNMDSYSRVSHWGKMILEDVQTKRMPPWHADPHYGKFTNDLSLTPDELRTLVGWVKQNFPRGEGADPLAKQPQEKNEWALGQPDLVFTLEKEQEIPATGEDLFLLLKADKPVERDLWIRAVDFKPGNVKVVHHCNLVAGNSGLEGLLDDATNGDKAENLKEEWYHLSGANMDNGQIIAGYSPGNSVFVLPSDTGIFVPAGAQINFRIHYIKTGKNEHDLSKVGFYLYHDQPKHIQSIDILNNRSIKISPSEKNYRLSASYTFQKNVLLTALQPHMHYRGKSMKFTIQYPDGKSEVILSVPNYKFRWQTQYVLSEPRKLPAGTTILADAVYDNSAENPDNPDAAKEVHYGLKSSDEMMSGILYYIEDRDH